MSRHAFTLVDRLTRTLVSLGLVLGLVGYQLPTQVAAPAVVVRGGARMLAAALTRERALTADDLADCDQAAWRTLRATLDDRQQSRAAQSRFRRDPAAYLNGLENRLSKLTLPT